MATSIYVSERTSGELFELGANAELLRNIAESSGGEVLTPDRLHEVVRLLQPPDTTMRSPTETTLWDHWLTMTLFFSLLTAEWFLRKLNGLP